MKTHKMLLHRCALWSLLPLRLALGEKDNNKMWLQAPKQIQIQKQKQPHTDKGLKWLGCLHSDAQTFSARESAVE